MYKISLGLMLCLACQLPCKSAGQRDGSAPLQDVPENGVAQAAVSPDGTYLATIEGGEEPYLALRGLPGGRLIKTQKQKYRDFKNFLFSPDGKYLTALMTANKQSSILFWEVPGLKQAKEAKYEKMTAYKDYLVFSGKHTFLAGDINLTKKQLKEQAGAVLCVSTDKEYLVTFYDTYGEEKLLIWSNKDGKLLKTIYTPKYGVSWAAFTPDGGYFVTACENEIKIWSAPEGKEISSFRVEGDAIKPAAGDGIKYLLVSRADPAAVTVYNLAGRQVKEFSGQVSAAADGGSRFLVLKSGKTPFLKVLEPEALRRGLGDGTAREIESLSAEIKAGAATAALYYKRGTLYAGEMEPANAISDLSEAIRLKPGYAEARKARAGVYRAVHRYAEAVADYSEALRSAPGNAELYYERGLAQQESGHYEPALGDYAEAVKLNPKLYQAYLYRGIIFLAAGKPAEARKEFFKVVLEAPAAEGYLGNLYTGLAYEAESNDQFALIEYNAGIKIKPDAPKLHIRRGNLYARTGQEALATADYDRALQLDPGEIEAYLGLGALHSEKDIAAAKEFYSKALSLSISQNATANFGYGYQYYKEGSYLDAVRMFKAAAELDPGNALYLKWRDAAQAADIRAFNAEMDAYYKTRRNAAAEIGAALGNIALGIAASVNTAGSSSGRSSYEGAGAYVASPGASRGNSGAGPDPYKKTREYNEQVRSNVEKKLWDMNNPYRLGR